MAPEKKADVLRIPNQLFFSISFFALFVTIFKTYLVHNNAVSYDKKINSGHQLL
jgi:hypothetical protein